MTYRSSIIFIFLLLVSACSQERAAIEDQANKFFGMLPKAMPLTSESPEPAKKTAEQAPEKTVQENAPPLPDQHHYVTVAHKDTLVSISRNNKVPLKDLIAVNHLTPPYHLKAGTKIELPSYHYYMVMPKDTLVKLSKHFHVSPDAIVAMNQIKTPYTIKKGQLLRIPSPDSKAITKMPPLVPAVVAQPVAAPKIAPTVPIIKKTTPVSQPQPQTSPQAAPKQQTNLTTLPKTRVAIHTAVANEHTTYDGPEIDSGSMSWPVKGNIISRFGHHKGGLFNDGINIALPENSPVHAARDGTVVYAGNELHGYGNLTILKHKGGLVTAYAHQKDMLVKKGDHVKRGQIIGHVGSTGNVTSPQLHFGVREGDKPVDPEQYLASKDD